MRILTTEVGLDPTKTYPEQDPQKMNALFIVVSTSRTRRL